MKKRFLKHQVIQTPQSVNTQEAAISKWYEASEVWVHLAPHAKEDKIEEMTRTHGDLYYTL
jgi:hypothetical protein